MANTHGTVVLGWRENHNAHGFGVATFYLRKEAPDSRLELVGLWDKLDEKLYAVTSGGADCVLYDFRLLTSTNKSKPAVLIRADRDMGETFADKEKVTFRFYVLREGFEGIPQGDPGSPSYMFDLVETQIAKATYCDVEEAFIKELGLGDYSSRTQP